MDQHRSIRIKWAKRLLIGVLVVLGLLWVIPLPQPNAQFSTVVLSSNDEILGARVANDGQWRFPLPTHLPDQLVDCMLLFEDEYFHWHPGINPISITRAIKQNMDAGKIVSGGSTITMQLARILRGNQSRNYWNKMLEGMIAIQLELKYSKDEILQQYAGLAPFGGNVVGVDAASWRYFGRPITNLSWAESATLAVLPNAPSLIHPGKRRDALKRKRDRLLTKLFDKEYIDQFELELAKEEPLPLKPFPLPMITAHLHDELVANGGEGQVLKTTINWELQRLHNEIAARHHERNHDNSIHNLAILTANIHTGEIISYVGNSDCSNASEGTSVNIINAPRSSGSILKPILYAAALDEGLISSKSLLPDIPTKIAGYTPKNFDKSYSGAISSEDALTKSLNIPAVRLLRDFGLEKFHLLLQDLNFSTIDKAADHYGLSLILGGGEVTLFDLVKVYRNLAAGIDRSQIQTQISNTNSSFLMTEQPPSAKAYGGGTSRRQKGIDYLMNPELIIQAKDNSNNSAIQQFNNFAKSGLRRPKPVAAARAEGQLSPGAIYKVMEILSNVERPRGETGWKQYSNGRKIAWKTGTSFGHRDAWAIGLDGDHVVGVWVGNADGEGRPGLTGLNYAGPILFDVFSTLERSQWFAAPYDELEDMALCAASGYRFGAMCTDSIYATLPVGAINLAACDFHTRVTTNMAGTFEVNRRCHPADDIKNQSYFTLPASQAYYYRKYASNYRPLPPIKPGCEGQGNPSLEIIYPFPNADVAVPVDLTGEQQELIFTAAHSNPKATLHWHIDDTFIGSTTGRHEVVLEPELGEHVIYIVDQDGVEERRRFEVVE